MDRDNSTGSDRTPLGDFDMNTTASISTPRRGRLAAAFGATMTVTAMLLTAFASPAMADDVLELETVIDGRSVEGAGSSDPIVLDPVEQITVELTVRNPTDTAITVARVRLEGEAMGLTFLVYDTGTSFVIDARGQRTLVLPLDFFDLEDQATGFLSSSIKLYDANRDELASNDFVADVKGRTTSTLGLFAIFALVFTIIALGVLIWSISRRRLAANRALRGMQFVLVGIGVGLCLALGLAVLRIAAVPATASVVLIAIPTIGAFAVGYVLPGFLGGAVADDGDDEDDDDDDNVIDDAIRSAI